MNLVYNLILPVCFVYAFDNSDCKHSYSLTYTLAIALCVRNTFTVKTLTRHLIMIPWPCTTTTTTSTEIITTVTIITFNTYNFLSNSLCVMACNCLKFNPFCSIFNCGDTESADSRHSDSFTSITRMSTSQSCTIRSYIC